MSYLKSKTKAFIVLDESRTQIALILSPPEDAVNAPRGNDFRCIQAKLRRSLTRYP